MSHVGKQHDRCRRTCEGATAWPAIVGCRFAVVGGVVARLVGVSLLWRVRFLAYALVPGPGGLVPTLGIFRPGSRPVYGALADDIVGRAERRNAGGPSCNHERVADGRCDSWAGPCGPGSPPKRAARLRRRRLLRAQHDAPEDLHPRQAPMIVPNRIERWPNRSADR